MKVCGKEIIIQKTINSLPAIYQRRFNKLYHIIQDDAITFTQFINCLNFKHVLLSATQDEENGTEYETENVNLKLSHVKGYKIVEMKYDTVGNKLVKVIKKKNGQPQRIEAVIDALGGNDLLIVARLPENSP